MEFDDRDQHNSLAAAPVTGLGQPPAEYAENYLQKIEEILTIVFDMDRPIAREAVGSFSKKWCQLDADDRLTQFHLSPLQVAADLGGAGIGPLPPKRKTSIVTL